jgi:YVTN family beta-propeller protein
MTVNHTKKILQVLPNRLSCNSLLFTLSFVFSIHCFGLVQASTGNTLHSDAELTNTIVANITVGYGPASAVVSPDNRTLYVASSLANNVSVIDTATNVVTATIAVPAVAGGIAITPDGSTLYVASLKTVSVIDTSTNQVSAKLKMHGAIQLAVSPDGKSLYVPDSVGVQVVDVATRKITGTVPYTSPAQALEVLFDPSGTYAYVLSITRYGARGESFGGILRVNTKSLKTVKCVWGKLSSPGASAITPTGDKIYIGVTGEIAIFATATKKITGNIPITQYEGLQTGIPAVTPDGAYLYWPMLQNILVIDTATGANAGIPIPLLGASFLTIAPKGSLAYAGENFGTRMRTAQYWPSISVNRKISR